MTLETRRTLRILIPLLALGLTNCGSPNGYENSLTSKQDPTTGYQTEDGHDYVVGADPRIQKEIDQNALSLAENPRKLEFHQSLKDFRLQRYDLNSSKPSPLGEESYVFEVLIQQDNKNSKVVVFSGHFQKAPDGVLLFNDAAQADPDYKVIGSFETKPDEVQGRFNIQFRANSQYQTATILYRGYRANLSVDVSDKDREKILGELSARIDHLKSDTLAWVNRFSVPFGVSTYDVAILKEHTEEPEPTLELRGYSIETEDRTEPFKTPKSPFTMDRSERVELVENERDKDNATFRVTTENEKDEEVEVFLEIEKEETTDDDIFQNPTPPPQRSQDEKVSNSDSEVPSYPRAMQISWGGRNESAEWTAIVRGAVSRIGKHMLQGTKDMDAFCPNYKNLDRENRLNFWAFLFAQMAKYESSYEPATRYVESGLGKDAVTGRKNTSEGLLQVSYQDSKYHKGGCQFDWNRDRNLSAKDHRKSIFNPRLNLTCGVQIMENQVRKYNRIVVNKGQGYWSILIKGHRNNKIAKIKAQTNQLSICRSKILMAEAQSI